MTDNICQIETAAVALRTRYSGDPGILLTDFSCAYPRLDHRWIFLVLERAGVPQTLRLFVRCVHNDPTTSVEHAGAARGQFAMRRGERHGCPGSATCSSWLSTPSTGGSCLLFCRLNPTDRGSSKDVLVLTPTILLSPLRLWASPSRR